MKKLLLILPLFLLISCTPEKEKNDNSNSIITQQISLSNYTQFIKVDNVTDTMGWYGVNKLVFSGALSFATYDIALTYSGVEYETRNEIAYNLNLNIGGGGETVWMIGEIEIKSISGTCTYKY